jgi:hypothetical protein
MNPIHWRREHLAAWIVWTVLGGIGGFLSAWYQSALYRTSVSSLSGEMSDTTGLFLVWIQYPHGYWLWSLPEAFITCLVFYALQLGKLG